MATNPLKELSSLPPQKLAVIAVVGVGAGLYWRRRKGHAVASTTSTATTPAVDTSLSALPTVGNLGAGAGSNSAGADMFGGGTRDLGTITLPPDNWAQLQEAATVAAQGLTLASSAAPAPTSTVVAAPNLYAVYGGYLGHTDAEWQALNANTASNAPVASAPLQSAANPYAIYGGYLGHTDAEWQALNANMAPANSKLQVI